MTELFQKCPHIDLIVKGEGEETIREIAQGKNLHAIPGIAYRENGQIRHNPNRPLPSVETLCYPNRGLRRYAYYIQPKGLKLLEVEFDIVLSSRGCPYNCKFCTFAINPLGQRRLYSARPPESVVEEIKGLDAEVIAFADDNFFVDPDRTERICDLLLEQGIQKMFIAQARIDIARYPARALKKLERAGFKILFIGIESPHDWILQQLQKGFTVQDVRSAFQVLKGYPFFYHCSFICGNLGERRAEMLVIARFAKEIGADSLNVHRLQAWEFTPLKELVEHTPGYHLTATHHVYSDTYSLDELKRIRKEIHRKFYTPAQFYRSLRKLYRIRVLTFSQLVVCLVLIPRLPALFYRILAKRIKKRVGGRKMGIPYA